MKTSMIFVFWSQAQKAIFMIKNQFTHISFLFCSCMIGAKYAECLNIRFYLYLPQNQVTTGKVKSPEIFSTYQLAT